MGIIHGRYSSILSYLVSRPNTSSQPALSTLPKESQSILRFRTKRLDLLVLANPLKGSVRENNLIRNRQYSYTTSVSRQLRTRSTKCFTDSKSKWSFSKPNSKMSVIIQTTTPRHKRKKDLSRPIMEAPHWAPFVM